MKIVAKTGQSTYLVDMTETELLNLSGFRHLHDAHEKHPDVVRKSGGGGWDRANYSFNLGAEISVSPIFKWANEMIAQNGRLLNAAKILTSVSEGLMENAPFTIVPPPQNMETDNG